MANPTPIGYKDGLSSVDNGKRQLIEFYWYRKALFDARKEMYFSQLASAINMPTNMGQTIKRQHWMPLLDDRNVNDQGIDAAGATIDEGSGNLYGSSKDIGTINKKLPTLGEFGGRVNRVGFTRQTIEAKIHKMGFFYEFSKDALQFDSDSKLRSHMIREAINGAVQITEAMLQKDLIAGAGVTVYPGNATKQEQCTAEGGTPTIIDYETLMRVDQILTDNRCPKQTTILSGTRMTDTRTIPSCRVIYIGSELAPLFMNMTRKIGQNIEEPAFIPVHQYAANTTPMAGEIGSVGFFRIIQVPEMLHWAGEGATVGTNPGFRETKSKYDVFPMLVVGDDSFNTIGFQSNGKSYKFNTTTKMPGEATADKTDPYGEVGFTSIKWWYGTLINRPERLALIKSVAPV